MGILNLTPDSFSDGGAWTRPDLAIERARLMVAEGADVLDVGGESTRPGAEPVAAEEQIRRTEPIIRRLAEELRDLDRPPPISIDTRSADVARAALDAGASIVNDVAAGRDDPDVLRLAADRGACFVLMHMAGRPATMQQAPYYDDVVGEVETFLRERIAAAEHAGIPTRALLIDPGIGFGKRREDNLDLLGALDRFAAIGPAVLLGASRKRFMGAICSDAEGNAPAPDRLVPATCAVTALGVMAGASVFRVHDVAENRQAADVAAALRDRDPSRPTP
jgi:dihydropteroate synthase